MKSLSFFKIVTVGSAILALGVNGAADAAETTTYQYDAQGRLIKTTTTGGAAGSNQTTTTTFDAAGNRISQVVTKP
jgi:RHS Repeat